MSTIINGTSSAITFPDSSVQNTSAIVSGYVPYANLPAGSVLQVVQASTTTNVTTASTSYVDSNLTGTITPKFATSKILVTISQSVGKQDSATASVLLNLVKNGSTVTSIAAYLGYTGISTPFYGTTCAYQYLDSPATTSALTYKTQVACNTAGGSALTQPNNSPSTITLLEIAA